LPDRQRPQPIGSSSEYDAWWQQLWWPPEESGISLRKAANKAGMPMSVYVRAKALEAARAG
jgi:hypothetical protein